MKKCSEINCTRVIAFVYEPYEGTYYRYCTYHSEQYEKELKQKDLEFKKKMVKWIRESNIKNLRSLHNAVEGEIRIRKMMEDLSDED